MTPPARGEVIVLSGSDIAALLGIGDCIDAVEQSFRQHAGGRSLSPQVAGLTAPSGTFHVKLAGVALERLYVAIKANANFPGNPSERALPTVQGAVLLFDGSDGRPLAVLDSAEITRLRTGAASAVAARYLARPDSRIATVVGCGVQGRVHLEAFLAVLPLTRVYAVDIDAETALAFARDASRALGIDVEPTDDLHAAALRSDVCITCTTSRRPLLGRGDVAAGAFVAAVGADNPSKQELAPDLLAASTVVVDSLDQCAAMGDLHHAIAAGAMQRDSVHAELADVVAGHKPARRSPEEIVIFDSTGNPLGDVAAAVAVFQRAQLRHAGKAVPLAF